MLALLAAAQLPVPEVNTHLHGFEVDFLWRAQRLVVEFDGRQFHGHEAAFERDRRRDQVLLAAGYRVLRVTWRQLLDEPLAVAVRIGQALAASVLTS
jgi:very-short-patch-repair endonuclease